MFQAAEARGGVKTGWGQQIEGEDGWCAKADFQSAGKRCAAASRVAVGKSQGSGRRERSFWSTEGTDYLDERLGRLSETVEVPHSFSSVSDSSFLRRAFVEATSSIAALLGVSSLPRTKEPAGR